MQTILGSGGIIGHEASYCLSVFSNHIRQVSRKPKRVNETDQIFPADLRIEAEVREAVKGSKVVYLTAGLPYDTKMWKEYWPLIMKNTIAACKEHQAKLVFFDNVYMYGKVDGWMTEDTPNNPCSIKGEVRAQISEYLMDEIKKENVQGLIARSADFYGPRANNTYINAMVFERLNEGKKPQLLLNSHTKHSYTFTPDAARAMALLGNTEDAYGKIWHLPTDSKVLTGEQFLKHANQVYGRDHKYSITSPFMIQLASIFSPVIRETKEMLYQFKYDYLFDSSPFEKQFFKATSYEEGIKATLKTSKKF